MLKNLSLYTKNIIIITENKNSALSKLSKNKKIKLIEHRNYIGGRYSVLTEVGMVPAYLMGLNISAFRKNILNFLNDKKVFLAKSVALLSEIYLAGNIKSIILMNYSSKFLDFNYWCQQLLSESLGKKRMGLIPIISQTPKDHHSLLQLYLDGPKDKIFYIFSSEEPSSNKIINNYFGPSFDFLKNKRLNNIIVAQKNALISILVKKNIPFREFKVKSFSETAIGELFSYFMLETIMLGKAINVDPFDQPAVELLKIATKKNLIS